MIDGPPDELIPILQVTRACAFPHGRRTPKRWARDGVRDPAGNVVRLQTERIGGRIFSTRRHVAKFLAAIQPGGGVLQVRAPEGGLAGGCGK